MLKILNEDTFKVSIHKDYNNINRRVEQIITALETIRQNGFYITEYTEKETEDIEVITSNLATKIECVAPAH